MKQPPARLTRDQAAIIGACTGIVCGPFSDVHQCAERLLGRPVFTHEMGDEQFWQRVKAAARDEFLAICATDDIAWAYCDAIVGSRVVPLRGEDAVKLTDDMIDRLAAWLFQRWLPIGYSDEEMTFARATYGDQKRFRQNARDVVATINNLVAGRDA
jgi:hypothetical protein